MFFLDAKHCVWTLTKPSILASGKSAKSSSMVIFCMFLHNTFFIYSLKEKLSESPKKMLLEDYEWKEVKRRSRSNSLKRDEKVFSGFVDFVNLS